MILYGIKALQAECLPQNFNFKDDVKTFSVPGATQQEARQKLNETIPSIGLVQKIEMEKVSLLTENNILDYTNISRSLNAHIGRFAQWECQKGAVHYVTVAIPKSEISYLPSEYREAGHILNNHELHKYIKFNKLNKICPNSTLITIDIFPHTAYRYRVRFYEVEKYNLLRGDFYISCGAVEVVDYKRKNSHDTKGEFGLIVRYWDNRKFKYEDHSHYWALELSKQYPLELFK